MLPATGRPRRTAYPGEDIPPQADIARPHRRDLLPPHAGMLRAPLHHCARASAPYPDPTKPLQSTDRAPRFLPAQPRLAGPDYRGYISWRAGREGKPPRTGVLVASTRDRDRKRPRLV